MFSKLALYNGQLRTTLLLVSDVCKHVTSLSVPRVSYLSMSKFPSIAKIEQTLSNREENFLLMRQNLFYFSGAGKFCLAHGLGQLTRDVKSDVRTLNFGSDVIFAPPQKYRMMFGKGRYVKNERNDE